jgi:tRNA modification GTPase
VEAGRETGEDEAAFLAELDPERTLLVRTKADLLPAPPPSSPVPTVEGLHVSAHDSAGLDELRRVLLAKAFGGILGEPGEAPLVTRERHARALRTARDEVRGFLHAQDTGVPMEYAATHLRAAAGALEDLVGAVTVDDILARVFGDFCVGK